MVNVTYQKIIDISLPLNRDTPIYPGNPDVYIEPLQSATTQSQISKIHFGSHTGTHIDAPRHVFPNGATIDQLPLDVFIGPCRVIDVSSAAVSISLADLQSKNIKAGERLLLKTRNSARGFASFYPDYVYVNSEAAHYLVKMCVTLIGIDSFSVKQKGSSDNTPHTALLSQNIPIVEGLNLREVIEGEYFLICVPLKFTDLDGAPARVLLLKL